MNSRLFSLISKAGSASLGELNARSSLPPSAIALEIAEMVRSGDVTLSFDANSFRNAALESPALKEVIGLIETPKRLVDLAETQGKLFVDGIEFALKDDVAANSINVNPTSRGFRYSAA